MALNRVPQLLPCDAAIDLERRNVPTRWHNSLVAIPEDRMDGQTEWNGMGKPFVSSPRYNCPQLTNLASLYEPVIYQPPFERPRFVSRQNASGVVGHNSSDHPSCGPRSFDNEKKIESSTQSSIAHRASCKFPLSPMLQNFSIRHALFWGTR